jgi:hypothetical protein
MEEKMKKTLLTIFVLLLVGGLLISACAPATPEPVEEEVMEVEEEEPVEEEVTTVDALPQGQELANAYAGMYEGTVVSIVCRQTLWDIDPYSK